MSNRNGELVTTAVTNMDIHDISRSARTYGAKGYFLVTPIESQHQMVDRILSYWNTGSARDYHPDRVEALSLSKVVKTFAEAKRLVRDRHGEDPEVILTDARPLPNVIGYADLRRELMDPSRTRPAMVVFGTGWGVSETFHPEVDRILAPIYGPEGAEGYNHLSVRAAVAIILDRLLGK